MNPISRSQSPYSTTRARREIRRRRLAYSFFGVFVPLFALLLASDTHPEWQDGRLATYAQLFLSGSVSVGFTAYVLFASGGLLFAVWLPRTRSNPFVRLALLCGLVLSIPYGAAAFIALELAEPGASSARIATFLIAGCTANIFFWRTLVAKFRQVAKSAPLIALLIVLAAHLSMMLFLLDATEHEAFSWWQLLYIPVLLTLAIMLYYLFVTAPFWAMWIYARWALRFPFGLGPAPLIAKLALAATWLTGITVAWRVGLQRLLLAYAELPTEPPADCFIASTAARGHISFVGAEPARTTDGQLFPVTAQLRRLKAAEWLLRELLPPLHRLLRTIYNTLGPRAAKQLRYPLLADAAWLALKPFELIAIMALRLLVADSQIVISRIWTA